MPSAVTPMPDAKRMADACLSMKAAPPVSYLVDLPADLLDRIIRISDILAVFYACTTLRCAVIRVVTPFLAKFNSRFGGPYDRIQWPSVSEYRTIMSCILRSYGDFIEHGSVRIIWPGSSNQNILKHLADKLSDSVQSLFLGPSILNADDLLPLSDMFPALRSMHIQDMMDFEVFLFCGACDKGAYAKLTDLSIIGRGITLYTYQLIALSVLSHRLTSLAVSLSHQKFGWNDADMKMLSILGKDPRIFGKLETLTVTSSISQVENSTFVNVLLHTRPIKHLRLDLPVDGDASRWQSVAGSVGLPHLCTVEDPYAVWLSTTGQKESHPRLTKLVVTYRSEQGGFTTASGVIEIDVLAKRLQACTLTSPNLREIVIDAVGIPSAETMRRISHEMKGLKVTLRR